MLFGVSTEDATTNTLDINRGYVITILSPVFGTPVLITHCLLPYTKPQSPKWRDRASINRCTFYSKFRICYVSRRKATNYIIISVWNISDIYNIRLLQKFDGEKYWGTISLLPDYSPLFTFRLSKPKTLGFQMMMMQPLKKYLTEHESETLSPCHDKYLASCQDAQRSLSKTASLPEGKCILLRYRVLLSTQYSGGQR